MAKNWGSSKPPTGSSINWSHPMSKGLVGCWLMNEVVGKIKDIANSYNSTTSSSLRTVGRLGSALIFNGSVDYYGIGDKPKLSITTGLTIISSVNSLSTLAAAGKSYQTIIAKRPSGDATVNYDFRIGQQSLSSGTGVITFFYKSDANYQIFDTGVNQFSAGEDFQTAISYDSGVGSSAKIFKNGKQLTASWVLNNGNTALVANTANVNIGIDYPSSEPFYGKMYYVYIYNRALSPSEIRSLYVNPYQFITRTSRISVNTVASTSCALSGTAAASITEADVVAGGKTIILTLTGDTWIAAGAASFDLQRQNIINGITSAQSELLGWNLVPKALQGVAGVVRTSDTVVTITLDAQATYDITATETITATVPATALTGAAALVAAPTFTVSAVTSAVVRMLALCGCGV